MIGVNPEVGHGANGWDELRPQHFTGTLDGKLFHIDLNGQHGPKFDQDLAVRSW